MLDDHIRFSEEPTAWWHSPLLGVYIIAATAYIVWRVEMTVTQYTWFVVPLFILELYSTLTTILHLILTRRLMHPVWRPALEGRTVDAFLPTYNEPPEIVEMTALGALRIQGIHPR
jgi:cellulose synthase (UDP-forming)